MRVHQGAQQQAVWQTPAAPSHPATDGVYGHAGYQAAAQASQAPEVFKSASAPMPGDPATLGYGTDQGRWLEEYRKQQAAGTPSANPFRQQR